MALPMAHALTDFAFLDGAIVPHQLDLGGHEISEPRHALRALFLSQAERLQHEALWIQPECSEVIRAILRGNELLQIPTRGLLCGRHALQPVTQP